MSSPPVPGPAAPVVADGQLGNIQYQLGLLTAEVRGMSARLDRYDDIDNRLRKVETNQVSQQTAQQAVEDQRLKAEDARASARKAMWAAIGSLGATFGGLLTYLITHH